MAPQSVALPCAWMISMPGSPEGEEEAPEEDPDQAIVDEGAEALLTTVDADAEIEGGAAWSLITSSCIPGVKYKIAAVRSNLWRGAVSVASGTPFTNIYVGNGFFAAWTGMFSEISAPWPAHLLV